MIIEMRTYTLKPGNIPTFEERFAGALAIREKFSKLAAFWHTEVGPLNQVIHVWPYDSLDQRASVRAAATRRKAGRRTRANSRSSRVARSSCRRRSRRRWSRASWRHLRDPHVHLLAWNAPAVMERWAEKVPGRIALSPLVGAWYSELGGLNKWCHIWAYKDAGERGRSCRGGGQGSLAAGRPAGALLKQENMLVVRAAFSPLR